MTWLLIKADPDGDNALHPYRTLEDAERVINEYAEEGSVPLRFRDSEWLLSHTDPSYWQGEGAWCDAVLVKCDVKVPEAVTARWAIR